MFKPVHCEHLLLVLNKFHLEIQIQTWSSIKDTKGETTTVRLLDFLA